MNAAYDAGRIALMLNELRLPTISRLWPGFAERSDKASWQASRLLGALLERELAERAKRESSVIVLSHIWIRPRHSPPSTSVLCL